MRRVTYHLRPKEHPSLASVLRGRARENDAHDEAKAERACSMGVGCGPTGVCYAEKMGRPELCPRALSKERAVNLKYRKKPVVIEAFRWTGGPDQAEDPAWLIAAIRSETVYFENAGTPEVVMLIDTLEGTHKANQGDWIIKGVNGELYPCKPDIFAATYEEVHEEGP